MKIHGLRLYRRGTVKRLQKKIITHPVIIVGSLVVAFLGALVTIDTSGHLIAGYIQNNWFWMSGEQAKLNKIAPEESVDYIKSVLGTPIVNDDINAQFSSLTFRGRGDWVYVINAKDSNKAVYVAVTACGAFKPTITNNPSGAEIKLGITKMNSVVRSTSAPSWGELDKTMPPAADRHYNVPIATSPLGIYEKHYLANPGRHQTIYAGFNAVCGSKPNVDGDVLSKLADSAMNPRIQLSNDQISRLRTELSINTFAVTGNDGDSTALEQILDKDLEIGVKSKEVELLTPPPRLSSQEIQKIRSMK